MSAAMWSNGLETLSGVVSDGFLYFSSYEQVAYEEKEKTDNENQVIILQHAIRNCGYADYAYKNAHLV
jgi:hypothetical protein